MPSFLGFKIQIKQFGRNFARRNVSQIDISRMFLKLHTMFQNIFIVHLNDTEGFTIAMVFPVEDEDINIFDFFESQQVKI